MEYKKFKQWIIENEFEDNELFIQSMKCFQVEAYKAAYLYSYLALINYAKEIILSYRGIPKPFFDKHVGKTNEEIEALWKKKISSLEHEDNWEEETLNFINEGNQTNVFKLSDGVRAEFGQKKVLRNASVHNKRRTISYTTVEDLWDFISYVKPCLVINGSIDMLLNEFEKIIQFSEKKDYQNDIANVYEYYFKMQDAGKKMVFDWAMKSLEENMRLWKFESMECIVLFFDKIFKNRECVEYNWIRNIGLAIYLKLNIEHFELKFSTCELQDYAYNNVEDLLSLLIPIGEDGVNCSILARIFSQKRFSEWWDILTTIARAQYGFKISDEVITLICESGKAEDILNEIEKQLYVYESGWKTLSTELFDYCKFNSYSGDIYIILRIIREGKLSGEKAEELVKRCKLIIDLDYSVDQYRRNYKFMYEFFERDKELFEWITMQ